MKKIEPIISLKEIEMNYGGKSLFTDLSLHIYAQDRICLIGKNGEGKSTLMHLLNGSKEPTKGDVWRLPGMRVGYLPQNMEIPSHMTVGEYVFSGLEVDDQSLDNEYMVDIVLAPLYLDKSWIISNLSGGQQRRTALAKALISKPDLLLLDEPTNHLDIASISWLEDFIKTFPGAVMVISHDRRFLYNISQETVWLDKGVQRQNNKGYSAFEEWSLRILEQEQKEINNLHKRLQGEDDWLHGGVTGRRNRNQRRLSELYAMRDKLKAARSQIKQSTAKINMDPLKPELASQLVAEFKSVYKAYDKKIISDFNYRISRGDKIGIIGKNGSGKSTFLKLLIGEIAPDEGSIKLGKTAKFTYFDQARAELNPDKSLREILCPSGGDNVFVAGRSMHVAAYLKRFLFDPKLVNAKAAILSGGQANRLLLAKALANPGSILIMDEPTNDLDMDTLDLIEEVLFDFTGTLILVSHDRDFIDRVVGKVLVFEGETIIDEYIGGYSDYLECIKGKCATLKSIKKAAKVEQATLSRSSEKMTYKLIKELQDLPGIIDSTKEEISFCEDILSNTNLYVTDKLQFTNLSQKLVALQEKLAESELRWLHLTIMQEELNI